MTVPVAGRGPQVAGVAGLFLALSTITIMLRCYCRAFVVKSFGLDDWSALVAWVRIALSSDETLMLIAVGALRFLLHLLHYRCASWHGSAFETPSTRRDTRWVEGKTLVQSGSNGSWRN
jgi:hypothetical protein